MKNKETIYVDVDDEITGIIDKVSQAKAKVVALVLPKRATVFQSIVNMKLLKRAAGNHNKNVVLVTSDKDILPLAGAVKMHVAQTLQATPSVPSAPKVNDGSLTVDEEEAGDEDNVDTNKSVGELAGLSVAAAEEEAIEIDNKSEEPTDKKDKPKAYHLAGGKNKIRIPNFEKFRLWLVLGAVALILLIIGWIYAFKVMPRATVTIKTKTQPYPVSLTLNLDTNAKSLDPSNLTVPATLEQVQKTAVSSSVNTTGKKNVGTPASGVVNMTAQNCVDLSQPADVSTGSVLQSNGLTYITQQNTSFGSPKLSGGCVVWKATSSTNINASNPGAGYNGATSFTVSGRQDVSASASQATSGGTDNVVQVVSATDLTNAQNQIASIDTSGVKNQLSQTLTQEGYVPITATFLSQPPSYKPSAEAGTQATTVTVTETITSVMFGASKADLDALIKNSVNVQIDPSKQSILNDGLSTASFNVLTSSSTSAQVSMNATSDVGPNLNLPNLKKSILGKKKGDIISMIQSDPGVQSVDVHYSPFWVTATPNNGNKVKLVLEKTNGSTL